MITIFYDFEVEMPEDERDKVFSGNSGIVLNEIINFVRQRIKPIEPDLLKYEDGYIMICIVIEDFQIRAYHYPEPLAKRILQSISEEDFVYIRHRVDLALNNQQGGSLL